MSKTSRLPLLATILSLLFTAPAIAKDLGDSVWSKERFQIRVRGIYVSPDSGGKTSINGSPDAADNDVVPEIDLTYFFTENIAAELIAATSKHTIDLDNSDAGDLNLGDTMILPPTLTLQYHFTPDNQFSPYLGAGINYTLPYNEGKGRDTNSVEADGSFGYALQAGADFWFDDHWGLNLDIKKIWVDVDASINSGAITGNVELNPLIIGSGISYRF